MGPIHFAGIVLWDYGWEMILWRLVRDEWMTNSLSSGYSYPYRRSENGLTITLLL